MSVQRCQHPPQAERCCWGGGPDPPSSRALLLEAGVGHDFRCAGGVPSNVRPLLRGEIELGRSREIPRKKSWQKEAAHTPLLFFLFYKPRPVAEASPASARFPPPPHTVPVHSALTVKQRVTQPNGRTVLPVPARAPRAAEARRVCSRAHAARSPSRSTSWSSSPSSSRLGRLGLGLRHRRDPQHSRGVPTSPHVPQCGQKISSVLEYSPQTPHKAVSSS